MYLGAYLSKMNNLYGQECWDMSYDNYCMAEVTNIESVLEKRCLRLTPKCVTPMRCGYCSDIDVTVDINSDEV